MDRKYLQLQSFLSEQQAVEYAQKEILDLLDDKQYLNPDKFQQLIQTYEKKQIELDNEINISIGNQADSLNQTKAFMTECIQNSEQMQKEIQDLDEFWQKDAEFHQELELYEQLAIFKKNIYQFVDELKYFLDVSYQIQRMEEKFKEQDFEYIFFKLLALTQLRDNVLEKMQGNSKDLNAIKSEFQELRTFEDKFYKLLYGKISDCIQLAKENPEQLIQIVKIVKNGDKVLTDKGKNPFFKEKAIEAIRYFIDKRFEQNLESVENTEEILQKSKFIVQDLIQVLENVEKKFPKDFDIFGIFEQQYKKNIEQKIMPIIQNEVETKHEYGSLMSVLTWIESFERVLSRAGREQVEYVVIKQKLSNYMIPFMDHIKGMFSQVCERAIELDKQDYFSYQNLQSMVKKKQPLESMFPEDIFKVLNEQISMLAPSLKNAHFKNYIEAVTQTIGTVLQQEGEWLTKVVNHNIEESAENEDVQLDLVLKISIFINNFQRCQKYCIETKGSTTKLCISSIQADVESLFKNLNQVIRAQIFLLYDLLQDITFVDIKKSVAPQFFSPKWVEEADTNLMSICIEKMGEIFNYLKITMAVESHLWHMEKQCFNHFVDLFFEHFIMSYKKNFSVCKEYHPKIVPDIIESEVDGKGGKKKAHKSNKKNKDQNGKEIIDQHSLLSSKELMAANLARDYDIFIKECENNYSNNLGKNIQDYKNKFMKVLDLLRKPKIDIENQMVSIIQVFQMESISIFQIAIYCVRDDLEQEYKEGLFQRFQSLLPKYIQQKNNTNTPPASTNNSNNQQQQQNQ